jgi:hypothetical protein
MEVEDVGGMSGLSWWAREITHSMVVERRVEPSGLDPDRRRYRRVLPETNRDQPSPRR